MISFLRSRFNSRLMELQMLMSTEADTYMKENIPFCSYQFKSSCVLDSLLAAFHIMFIKFPNVKVLFNSDKLFQNIMGFLNGKKYAEAKLVCAWQLKHVKFDHTCKEMYLFGNIQQHFPLFDKLVCTENSNDSPILDEIVR